MQLANALHCDGLSRAFVSFSASCPLRLSDTCLDEDLKMFPSGWLANTGALGEFFGVLWGSRREKYLSNPFEWCRLRFPFLNDCFVNIPFPRRICIRHYTPLSAMGKYRFCQEPIFSSAGGIRGATTVVLEIGQIRTQWEQFAFGCPALLTVTKDRKFSRVSKSRCDFAGPKDRRFFAEWWFLAAVSSADSGGWSRLSSCDGRSVKAHEKSVAVVIESKIIHDVIDFQSI